MDDEERARERRLRAHGLAAVDVGLAELREREGQVPVLRPEDLFSQHPQNTPRRTETVFKCVCFAERM